MIDQKAIDLLAAFRGDKSHVHEHIETLHDEAYDLRMQAKKLLQEADMKDEMAAHLVAEANEHLPNVRPDTDPMPVIERKR